MTAISVRLIGGVAVERDGARVALPASRKTRALLAYLAVSGVPQRREKLCSLLWDMPDDPRGALRWSLSKLRGLLDTQNRNCVIADREAVRLELGALDIDVLSLLRLASSTGDAATSDLEAAAEFCKGEFCAGLDLARSGEFMGWCHAVREDVRQAQVAVLRELVHRLSSSPGRVVPFARQLVELDPLDENAREWLVDSLRRSGREGEAEQQRLLAAGVLSDAAIPVPVSLTRTPKPVAAAPATAITAQQRVQFCNAADGTSIAYSIIGEGPVLVKTANWLNHLEYEWESPIWRHWLRELSADRTLLRYDERGNGLSDWKVADLSFEAMVQDLETVVDNAGLESFDLLGISQGSAVSIAYAVRHPARVRKMVLIGGYAAGWRVRSDSNEVARREAMLTLTEIGWGQNNPAYRQLYTSLYFPEATPEQADWFNELQRISTSPLGAARLQESLSEIDVRDMLGEVGVPTLVMHSRDDGVVPFDAGRAIASRIPNARFVALDSNNHLILEHEPAWGTLVNALRDFLVA